MIEAFCTICGRDCTHANATYMGDIVCIGCIPSKKKKRPDTGCDDDKLDGSADDWRKALENF